MWWELYTMIKTVYDNKHHHYDHHILCITYFNYANIPYLNGWRWPIYNHFYTSVYNILQACTQYVQYQYVVLYALFMPCIFIYTYCLFFYVAYVVYVHSHLVYTSKMHWFRDPSCEVRVACYVWLKPRCRTGGWTHADAMGIFNGLLMVFNGL